MYKPKIEVFIDANLFMWMPDIEISSPPPKGFDRKDEQIAFKELLDLRKKRIINMYAWDKAIDNFMGTNNESRKIKFLQYYLNRISNSHTSVMAGSELADTIKMVQDILSAGGEKQDDIAVFTLTYVVKTEVSHVATLDDGFPDKVGQYLNILKKHKKLYRVVEFRRRCNPYYIGSPSEILSDINHKLKESL